ncbi:Ig-like domain-containing protein [Paenibacillus sp. sgz500958]|uniref:Ig-like domain-containing protein n=1 Tax=Paenibacillus sp. sgz500958 TaxID=3242475 RepID=UPI0036D24D60
MMKLLLIFVLLTTAIFPAGAFAATGDTVSIDFDSSTKVELTVGQTPKQLKVLATIEGSSTKRDVTASVVWSNSDTSVVKVSSGLLTPLNYGSASITATYNGAVTTIEVGVSQPYTKLTLDPSADVKYKLNESAANLMITATATGGKSVTTETDVTESAEWISSDSGVLTVSKGKMTLVGDGTATVTAKFKGLTASFKATVTLPYSSITITDAKGIAVQDLELIVGDTPKLLAETKEISSGAKGEATTQASWSSSNTAVATVDKGALKVLSTGKTTITATYMGVTSAVDVYVRSPHEALILAPTSDQALFMNESLKVKATVRSTANEPEPEPVTQSATWTSSNPLTATIAAAVDAENYKSVTAKAVGTTTLKVEYLGLSKSIKLTVYPTLTKIAADKTELVLYTSDSVALPKVNGTKLDETTVDMSGEIEWTSGDEEVAKVKDGKIVAGSPGTVTITGKFKGIDNVSSESPIRKETVAVKVTVKDKVLVLVGPEDAFGLVIGEEQSLPEVNAVMESGEEKDVTDEIEWTLSGSNAVIKQTAKGKVIKGLVKGSATLKGTYGNKTLSVPVKIEQKVVKLVVEPNTLELNIKGSKSIKVTGFFSTGKSAVFSTSMNWESSDNAIVSVKGSTVKALAEGTVTLKGSYQGIAVSVKITVVPKLMKLTVDETRLTLAPGAAQAVVVKASYDTGNTSVVTGSTIWTSSKPSVATVSPTGVITAVAKGTASIKGKLGSKTVTVSVTVK